MVTKNIAITEEAYGLLARHKHPDESFSEVIKEHFKKKRHLLDYAGAWADMPEKEWKALQKAMGESRKGLNQSFKRRSEALR